MTNATHKWYLELARKYQLQEAVDYAGGFYAVLKGTVWLDDGKSRAPAPGAVVRVVDPKDNTTWETTAGADGRYMIKGALLHAHKDAKGKPRCPVFRISASHEGDQTEDAFEGKLADPDPSAELNKDLVIKRRKAGDLAVQINGNISWKGEDKDKWGTISTTIAITGTMSLDTQNRRANEERYKVDDLQLIYSHHARFFDKKAGNACSYMEVIGEGSAPVQKGRIVILYPRDPSRKHGKLEVSLQKGSLPTTWKINGQTCETLKTSSSVTGFSVDIVEQKSPIGENQREFSGSHAFGIIDFGRALNLALAPNIPFGFKDDESGTFAQPSNEIERMLTEAARNVEQAKIQAIGITKEGNDGRLTWSIRRLKK